jgi:hypothetical protein
MNHNSAFSQTEFETLCGKAARGAGLDWGLAEEAGKAAGWMYIRGINAASALVKAISSAPSPAPICGDDNWGGQTPICPIHTGAALVDYAGLNALPSRITNLRQPVMIIPFLAMAADLMGCQFDLLCNDIRLSVTAQAIIGAADDLCALTGLDCATVQITAAAITAQPDHKPQFAVVDPSAIAALDALGARTYVPATESSRQSGAGAGTSDND